MKQAEFTEVVGTSVDLVRSWEQQRRVSLGIALKMLWLIEPEPASLMYFVVLAFEFFNSDHPGRCTPIFPDGNMVCFTKSTYAWSDGAVRCF